MHRYSIPGHYTRRPTARSRAARRTCSCRWTDDASRRSFRYCRLCRAMSRRSRLAGAASWRGGRARRNIGWSARGLRVDLCGFRRSSDEGRGEGTYSLASGMWIGTALLSWYRCKQRPTSRRGSLLCHLRKISVAITLFGVLCKGYRKSYCSNPHMSKVKFAQWEMKGRNLC